VYSQPIEKERAMSVAIGELKAFMVQSLAEGEYMPEWASISIKEASEQTGYNEEYLRRLCRNKKLEYARVGLTYLLKVESLNKYLEEMEAADDARTGPRRKKRK
jgi:excisionase family DNA binding protein